jgi:hypothetical protein
MRYLLLALTLVAGCHELRGDNKPASPGDVCRECCQKAAEACRLDSDRPAYYCPGQQQECVTACAQSNENEMCVIETERQFATRAPKPLVAASAQASGPPVAAVHRVAETSRGECDNRGTWNLKIGDTKGHAAGCAGLPSVPRDVSFRIERRRDLFALEELVPAPGWQDGFSVDNHEDVCVVVLTRDNHADAERPRRMVVQLSEKEGKVVGTFHYRENLLQPVDCELDAVVSGIVIAPAPRAAPPLPPLPLPSPVQQSPTPGGPRIGGGNQAGARPDR